MIAIFKKILKKEGIKAKWFSKRIGLGYGSYRTMISSDSVPRWVKAFVFGYGVGKASTKDDDCCEKCGMESYLVNVMGCRDEYCPERGKEVSNMDVKGVYIDPKTLEDKNI